MELHRREIRKHWLEMRVQMRVIYYCLRQIYRDIVSRFA